MTDKPNIKELSQEFCELTGIEFVEYWWCPKCQEEVSPARVTFDEKCDTCMSHVEWKEMLDFTDAREVLKVMRKREDYGEWLSLVSHSFTTPERCVLADYILDTTGLLLKEAVEWLKGREKEREKEKEATFVYYAFKKEEAKADERTYLRKS